jgi:serine/threonine protein kinase
MVWAVGYKLQGDKYIIEQVLGQGGFGVTYKARHRYLNNLVVIKTPNESLRHDPEYPKYVKRFLEEGQRLEKLCETQHPNIVRVRDLFDEGGTYCLVMDFVQGESLFNLVQRRGALSPQEAVNYINQIGEALKVVHQAGLVHRDAHPGNIMVQQDGRAVLIDFGIAGETVPITVSSKFFANVAFAPYEQIGGGRKPSVDVYSLAASLYYAVTGQRPATSLDRKLYNTPLIPPQQHVSSISDRLQAAILKGMELEPQDRPQTMQEWLEMLTPIQVLTVWLPGYQLQSGKYIIIRMLAQGGFGVTYLARSDRGEQVVIKTLNETVQCRPDFAKFQEDFVREALRLAKCSHPHIVRVNDVFQQGQLWCIVMEYIQGKNLADIVANRSILPEAEAIGYIQQIGEALTVVHKQGLLHRDVKPANIIIRANQPEAVLIDFGIAREFTHDLTQLHTANLSDRFAPIEQYLSVAKRGAYTDVYALAATLYFLLTKRLPPPAPLRANGTEVLEPPQQINPSISNRVNEAILKGMELKANNRPQSMQEWLQLLKEPGSQNHTNLSKTPSSPPSPTAWSRRRVIQTTGLIAAGFAATVVGQRIFSNTSNQTSREQPTSPTPTSNTPTSSPTNATVKEQTLQTFYFETVSVDVLGKITNRQNHQANYFVEDLGNGVTLEMVQIPGGKFLMGSPKREQGRRPDEGPQHQVTVPGFFIGKYEITQAQYQAIMGNNPSDFREAKRPVERVSWNEAVEFCKRLSQKTGHTYRLPSEAEWEYAVRAGTTTAFYFGETITTNLVNYNGNYTYAAEPKGQNRQQTTNVGSFPPNAFGLYDMHGNMWEWCADHWHENYIGAPTDGSAWVDENNNDGRLRVQRGGSWYGNPEVCRSAVRLYNVPNSRRFDDGFRVVYVGVAIASR